jgi:hypothetical protein
VFVEQAAFQRFDALGTQADQLWAVASL